MPSSRPLSRALRPLLAASVLCAVLPPAPSAAQPAPAPREALLVTPAWLAGHLRDPDLVLLHVGTREDYDRAHIPGARHVAQDALIAGPRDPAQGKVYEMPTPDTLRARLEALGVGVRSRVVVYWGTNWVSPATRVVFTLDHAGLGDRTVLLDGGMPAWQSAGQPVTAEAPATPAAAGRLSPLRTKALVVDAEWVNAHRTAKAVRIVDARSASFYDGVGDGGVRKGHIAGALSIPFNTVTGDSLRLKSPAELRELFTKAGVAPGDTIVGYCHIGQQATAMLFAARTLGHPVLLYDGSFTEWERIPTLPVETTRRP